MKNKKNKTSRPGQTQTELTYEQWLTKYKPVKNHLDTNASHDGIMFETNGPEKAFINQQPDNCIWTEVNGDDGEPIICSGYHYVNRNGYFVCSVPYTGEPADISLED